MPAPRTNPSLTPQFARLQPRHTGGSRPRSAIATPLLPAGGCEGTCTATATHWPNRTSATRSSSATPPWANNSPPHNLQNCLQLGVVGNPVEAIGDPLHPALPVAGRGGGTVSRGW